MAAEGWTRSGSNDATTSENAQDWASQNTGHFRSCTPACSGCARLLRTSRSTFLGRAGEPLLLGTELRYMFRCGIRLPAYGQGVHTPFTILHQHRCRAGWAFAERAPPTGRRQRDLTGHHSGACQIYRLRPQCAVGDYKADAGSRLFLIGDSTTITWFHPTHSVVYRLSPSTAVTSASAHQAFALALLTTGAWRWLTRGWAALGLPPGPSLSARGSACSRRPGWPRLCREQRGDVHPPHTGLARGLEHHLRTGAVGASFVDMAYQRKSASGGGLKPATCATGWVTRWLPTGEKILLVMIWFAIPPLKYKCLTLQIQSLAHSEARFASDGFGVL